MAPFPFVKHHPGDALPPVQEGGVSEPDLLEQFEQEADDFERAGKHAEAGVLRSVVVRLRPEPEHDELT